MYITEEQAKTKWCPMFRAAIACSSSGGNEYTTNRDSLPTTNRIDACIGSACMAWRKASLNPTETHGFCGAFGTPL